MNNTDIDLATALKMARLIAFSMLIFLICLSGVAYWLTAQPVPLFSLNMEDNTLSTIRYAFASIAAVTVLMIPILKNRLMSSHSNHEFNAQRALTQSIVLSALSESIGVLGFVLSLLTANAYDCYGFVVVAIIMVLMNMPTERQWRV